MPSLHFLFSTAVCVLTVLNTPSVWARSVDRRTSTGKLVHFLDNFDSRFASPVGVGPTNAAGVFGALNYASFSLAAATANLLNPPPSKPNFISAGPVGGITNGAHQLLPANSTVKYFNLEKVRYACAAQSGLAPVSCTILVSGKRLQALGGTEEQVELVFNKPVVSSKLVSAYAAFSFPAAQFSMLQSVTVTVIEPAAALPLALFDNFEYTAYIQK
ncbi:hypothetical protein G7Y79_00057g090880 [Physcia stellaris]|nr:hypothetical protein G7Y79_00057g090880 [Physcia stellaris]